MSLRKEPLDPAPVLLFLAMGDDSEETLPGVPELRTPDAEQKGL